MGWLAAGLGGAALAGQVVGGMQTNATNMSIAEMNNATAINLADTAHQREVADLKAAGLNPILSAGGSGAPVPGLTSATVGNPYVGSPGAANQMIQGFQLQKQLDQMTQNTATSKSQQDTNIAQQDLLGEQTRKASADADTASATAFSAKNRMQAESKHPELYGTLDAVLGRLGLGVGTARDIAGTAAAGKYLLQNVAKN